MDATPPQATVVATEFGFRITGDLRRGGPRDLLPQLKEVIARHPGERLMGDLSEVKAVDSLGAALLAELVIHSQLAGKSVKFTGAEQSVAEGLKLYYLPAPEKRARLVRMGAMERIGTVAGQLWEATGEFMVLISETIYWSIVALFNPAGHRRGAIGAQALILGVGAAPVILLLTFLVGIVLALLSAQQLRQFGANIYIADLVTISMTREMGPLMTAIMLAGRSGASIAAEISSMTVSEENDALRTMGINPIRYVVVPKLLGLTITAPLVSLLAVMVGIFGGLIIAVTALNLSPQAFFLQATGSVILSDVLTGELKSLIFAWLIVLLSAFFGFRVTGGSEGVGRQTTRAVVASIFAVVVADCALDLLFYL